MARIVRRHISEKLFRIIQISKLINIYLVVSSFSFMIVASVELFLFSILEFNFEKRKIVIQCFFVFGKRTWPYRDRDLVHYDRSWPFLTVPDRSWPFLTVPERSWPFLKRSEMVRNGHGNGQERWTARDGERNETIILYQINGQKRLQNHVHGAFTVRSRSRFKNERITVLYTD